MVPRCQFTVAAVARAGPGSLMKNDPIYWRRDDPQISMTRGGVVVVVVVVVDHTAGEEGSECRLIINYCPAAK